jgi:hypothetical protein
LFGITILLFLFVLQVIKYWEDDADDNIFIV